MPESFAKFVLKRLFLSALLYTCTIQVHVVALEHATFDKCLDVLLTGKRFLCGCECERDVVTG